MREHSLNDIDFDARRAGLPTGSAWPSDSASFDAAQGISIAMATYNGAPFIDEQLDSIERQRRRPDEMIVCDDQSTDDTVHRLERFARRASFPVKIHVNPQRLGWRANFMRATGFCSHALIAFSDQDDIWYPEKLSTMAPHFEDPSMMMVYHNADLVDTSGTPYDTWLPVDRHVTRIEALSRPTAWINPNGLTMMFRSMLTRFNDLWPDTDWPPSPEHPFAHDQWFFDLATNLGTVLLMPERLLGYRQHGGNSVGWTNGRRESLSLPRNADIRQQIDEALRRVEPFHRALTTAASRENGPLKTALRTALDRNRRLVERLEERRRLYMGHGLATRLRVLCTLVGQDAYSQRHDWGLGRRAFLLDASFGALLGGRG